MVALRLAIRFLFSKKRYGIINAITWLAAIVTVFVAAAMIIILSAFNGIQDLVVNLYNSTEAPYSVQAPNGESLRLSNQQLMDLKQNEHIAEINLRCSGEVIFQYNQNTWYGVLVGSDDNLCQVSGLSDYLEDADYCTPKTNELIIGAGVRYKLQYPRQGGMSPVIVKSLAKDQSINTRTVKNIKQSAFYIANAFSVNAEYDLKYAFTQLEKAQNILGYDDNEYSSIELQGSSLIEVENAVKSVLGNQMFRILTEDDRLGDLKRTANIEKWISLLMLCLVLLIAAFNLIAAITMLIIDKKQDLETLHIMGFRLSQQHHIFVYILLLINLGGALVGLFLGSLLVWLQESFGIITMSQSVVDYYPVEWKGSDALIILSLLMLTAALAQFPVRWVSKRLA